MTLALPKQSKIKELTHKIDWSPVWWMSFLNYNSLFQGNSSLCYDDSKLGSTRPLLFSIGFWWVPTELASSKLWKLIRCLLLPHTPLPSLLLVQSWWCQTLFLSFQYWFHIYVPQCREILVFFTEDQLSLPFLRIFSLIKLYFHSNCVLVLFLYVP